MEPFPWTCPYCARPVTIREQDCVIDLRNVYYDEDRTVHGAIGLIINAIACPNPDCRQLFLKVALHSTKGDRIEELQSWQLMPESNAKPQPDYIPAAIVENYFEACRIKDLSPKASATLSRRCLQGMIRDFWKVTGKRNLWAEIEAIKDEGDASTWKAIDAVRQVGKIGAHMEQDVNLIIDVEPQEAQALIGLIEMLFKDWYVARYEKEQRTAAVIALGAEKQEQMERGKEKPSESPADEG